MELQKQDEYVKKYLCKIFGDFDQYVDEYVIKKFIKYLQYNSFISIEENNFCIDISKQHIPSTNRNFFDERTFTMRLNHDYDNETKYSTPERFWIMTSITFDDEFNFVRFERDGMILENTNKYVVLKYLNSHNCVGQNIEYYYNKKLGYIDHIGIPSSHNIMSMQSNRVDTANYSVKLNIRSVSEHKEYTRDKELLINVLFKKMSVLSEEYKHGIFMPDRKKNR